MSSSDSEDDCYGNVAEKLQSIKNNYQPAPENTKPEETSVKNILNIDISSKEDKNTPPTVGEDLNMSTISTDNDELTLDAIIANNTKRTRGRPKRKTNVDASTENPPNRGARSSRRRAGNSKHDKSIAPVVIEENSGLGATNNRVSDSGSNRARGANIRARGANIRARGANNRARGANARARSRGHGSRQSMITNYNMPIYSVGNTDEYPDSCDTQALFSTKNEDIVIIGDPDPLGGIEEVNPLDDNEELSVKVYWQNLEVFKFKIRKYQKLTQIFDYFSNKENVSQDKLLFTYNDRILKADDTPDSLDYNIAKFIDGGIVNQNVKELINEAKENHIQDGIRIKFQCQNLKKPYETVIRLEDKLAFAMMKYAEHIEKPIEKLKFYFDGDLINGKTTALGLELEGGECIDVKLFS